MSLIEKKATLYRIRCDRCGKKTPRFRSLEKMRAFCKPWYLEPGDNFGDLCPTCWHEVQEVSFAAQG